MRIIRAAKQKEEAVLTCLCCKSIIGIRQYEIREERNDNYVECPVCKERISGLNPRELFPWIMEDENEVPSDNPVRINSF